jgi:hypothetical protein
VFGSPEWHLLFPNIDLQALSTLGSDHAPLLIGDVTRQNYLGFRFESYWVNMPGFYDAVQAAWAQPVNTQDPILKDSCKTYTHDEGAQAVAVTNSRKPPLAP